MPPSRIRLFVLAGLLLFGGFAVSRAAEPAASPSRPNIVLILADDLGYEALSCYGSASYHTPNLDRLAASGMQFMHAYSQPVCTPSRIQLLTGQYNVRNYLRFGEMRPDEKTLGNFLQDRGYATCIAGKWQLGGDRNTIANFGFERYLLWWLEKKTWRYLNPGDFIQDGVTRHGRAGEYGPDVMCDYALNFIGEHAKQERPFFCFYPMMLTHAPFTPTPLSTAKLKGRSDSQFFADMVFYMDRLVGRVMDKLDELGIRDNTILIFAGDNGTNDEVTSRMTDGSTIRGGKDKPTDAGTRVPLLISWPAVVKPAVIEDSLVDFSDFVPTLCEAAGYAPEELPAGDGISLMPLLHGDRSKARDWSYCWISPSGSKEKAVKFARTVRYKLYPDGRFYDLAQDVLETHPIATADLSDELRAVVARLQEILDRYAVVEAARPPSPPEPKFGKNLHED